MCPLSAELPEEWTKLTGYLTVNENARDARLNIVLSKAGTIDMDMISLFPVHTYLYYIIPNDLFCAFGAVRQYGFNLFRQIEPAFCWYDIFLILSKAGTIDMDMISLFPVHTYL